MSGPTAARSSAVVSNQIGVHRHLDKIVRRHLSQPFQKPYNGHTQAAFFELAEIVEAQPRPLILDSGCGVGASSYHLAEHFIDALVIGIDKSSHRLNRRKKNRKARKFDPYPG